MTEQQTWTTSEVAIEVGVKTKTLQFWVREGLLSPRAAGEGRQRRLTWSADDIAQARELKREGGKAGVVKIIEAKAGDGFLASFTRAQALQKVAGPGQVVVSSAERARIYRDDTTLREVIRSADGLLILLP